MITLPPQTLTLIFLVVRKKKKNCRDEIVISQNKNINFSLNYHEIDSLKEM